jgi:predicted aspartyl protease
LHEQKNKGTIRNYDIYDKYVNYINGQANKPRTELPHNNKLILNKPVIHCRVASHLTKVLLDTGATCNVIDAQELNKLKEKFKMYPSNRTIYCANSSNMSCIGEVILNFEVGGNISQEKFLIVNNLKNNKCIIGIRTMKKIGLELNITKECASINHISIPLISKINAATCDQGKGRTPKL